MTNERPDHDPNLGSECQCFRCHITGVNLGFSKDFPTKTRSSAPPAEPNNSWERGIPTQKRPGGTEMPYLRSDGEVMRVHEFAEKRSLFEENNKVHTAPVSTQT